MQINCRLDGDKVVLALSGRLTRGEHLELLREKVNALLSEGYRDFVFDLKSVSYVDSAGLDELVEVYSSVQREGNAVLRLAGLNERLADLSVVSKLRSLFEAYPHEHTPDPLGPGLRDFSWELQVGLALAILLIIGLIIILR